MKNTLFVLNKNNKGNILFLVIIFGLILSFVGIAFIYMTGSEQISVNEEVARSRAFYAAEAGLERAITKLKNDYFIEYSTTDVKPFASEEVNGYVIFQPEPAHAPAKYSVTIKPEISTTVVSAEKYFTIVSTGVAGEMQKQLSVRIQLSNWMRYMYYSNNESNGQNTSALSREQRIYFSEPDKFYVAQDSTGFILGGIFSNDIISIHKNGPKFYLISAPNNELTDPKIDTHQTFYHSDNALPSQYNAHQNKPEISLFENWNTDSLRTIAQTRGRYFSTLTPINITIGNNRVSLTGGASETINLNSGKMILFCNGNVNINGMANTNDVLQRYLTIVTASTMTITNNVKCSAGIGEGSLGLLSNNCIVISAAAPSNLEIDAFMMSDGFYAINYDTKLAGTLIINGVVIQKNNRGEVGKVDADAAISPGIKYGYSKEYHFDTRILSDPPPYFPRYNTIRKSRWREEPFERIPL